MACHKGWSREILFNNFTQKFVSHGYKARRESLLLEREKSLMPATQPYVEIERQVRSITSDIARKRKELEDLNRDWQKIESLPLGPLAVENGLVHEFDALILRHKMSQDQRKMVSNVMIDIQHMEWWQERLMVRLHGDNIDNEKRQFVRACPAPECRGFLSTAWKCGVCDNWACPECHEVKGTNKDEPHTCDPNSVETAKLLAKDSRHCPKCAAIIFKIDGCDQMYCTQCHTAFSWRTGRIETGVIHNPHYYEYHRQRVPSSAIQGMFLVADFQHGTPFKYCVPGPIIYISKLPAPTGPTPIACGWSRPDTQQEMETIATCVSSS